MAEISGWVQSVVYQQDDFYVLNFAVEEYEGEWSDKRATARGNLYGLIQVAHDVPLKLIGKWVKHQKYGRQLQVQTWQPWATSKEGVARFLRICVEGFADQVFTSTVVEKFGTDTFDVLTNDSGKIRELSDHAETAILGWQNALATRDLSALLKAGGLAVYEIQGVMAKFGLEASEIIRDNPYRLMEVPGLSFIKVDKLGNYLGIDPDDPKRLEGAAMYAVQGNGQQGHLFTPRGEIPQLVQSIERKLNHPLPTGTPDAYGKVLDTLIDRKALVLDPAVGVYVPDLYKYERESAKMLAALKMPSTITTDATTFLAEYERANAIELSDAQGEAVRCLVNNRVLVLTGLPGTGKTTVVKTFVRLFEEARVTFALMAPTGIAAKRIEGLTGHPAATIHRALRYDGQNWGYGPSNRYLIDAVIVDEMSMVDQELFFRLLSALRPETMLILVGDDAQLPSVGPGNVLKELVACEGISNIRLTQIFRQSERSDIVLNSHRINRGEMPELKDPKVDSEFKFVRLSDKERITALIVDMAARLKEKDANFQILSPMYDRSVGVNNLNDLLRERLNPQEGQMEWKRRDLHFRVGDRLMVVKNDYQRGVYNGDVGKLVRVGKDQSLTVRIHGGNSGDTEVDFPDSEVPEKLRLAYAITVHKSQGSEFDTIIMPIMQSQGRMLQRNLLYTAITRARKRVWLIGEEAAIFRAVQNDKVVQRNTVLGRAVTAALAEGGENGR